jgi:hypothetical protein
MRSEFAVWASAMATIEQHHGSSLASTTTSNREQSPGVRSQHSFEDRFTVPFLLPGSKIERRNSIKAQQMLGLVTHVRKESVGSQRISITRARSRSEERLRLESMDMEDEPRSPASERPSKRDSLKAQELLGLVTHVRAGREPKRTSYLRARSRSEERPLLYRRSFDSVEQPPSPTPVRRPRPLSIVAKKELAKLSPSIVSPRSISAEQPRPRTADRLPRPLSIITHKDAPKPKPSPNIASPRSIGTSVYINFSRPLSQQQSPKPVHDQTMEIDPVRQRLSVARDDIGLPRTPSQANTSVQAKPIFEKVREVGGEKQDDTRPNQRPRRRSKVWTSLPMCLVRLRKGSVSESSSPSKTGKKDGPKTPKTPLTEDNLRSHEFVVGSVPRPLNRQLLPTPLHSPLEARNLFSKLDYDEKPLPTPPSSPSSVLGDGLTPPLNGTDAPPNSTFRTPSITPTLHIATSINVQPDLSICEVCREAKGTLAFPVRQCTGKCRHPPHTCVTCIEQWISSCVETKGWDQCVCPECKERLSYEDVKFFATEDVFLRYGIF